MASAGHRELDAWAAASIVNQELKPAQPSPKKSRRVAQKRVVSIPIGDAEGHRPKNAAGEGFPPSDSWAWRKYGQKPIKGSPYPRGYYRCSSWKGCPARKQVERSLLDPSLLTITYSFDHNHPWPLPRNGRHHQNRLPPAPPPHSAEQHTPPHPPQPTSMSRLAEAAVSKPEEKQPDEKEPLMMVEGGGLEWFSDVASPSSTSAGSDELLYGSVLFGGTEVGLVVPEKWEAVGEAEEDSLFAGLGELPEYSVVLRRGLAAEPWVGSTG